MKVGILGSGDVATTLGAGFITHGHDVMLGTRDISKLAGWVAKHPKGRVGSVADAAGFGELLVLAVKGTAAADALRAAGPARIAGKVILDATNPIAEKPPTHGVLHYFTTGEDSLMERLQREFGDARFVKCFSCVGSARMVNPDFKQGRPAMFICGNDDTAKAAARGVLDQFGWETVDMGRAEAARAIEPLAILWCIPGFLRNEWTHAFALLKS